MDKSEDKTIRQFRSLAKMRNLFQMVGVYKLEEKGLFLMFQFFMNVRQYQ